MKHPTNRKIIEALAEKNLSFTQLLNICEKDFEHGRFGYHLRSLKGFIKLEPQTKKYQLTYRGQLLLDVIREVKRLVKRRNQPLIYIEQLTLKDHAFALCNDKQFKQNIVFSHLRNGLLKGCASVYVVDEKNFDDEVLSLKSLGVDINDLPQNALLVMSSSDCYLKKGKADHKIILDNWLRLLKDKEKEGFRGLHAACEMATFIDNNKISELLKYESSLGRSFNFNISSLCIYNQEMFVENNLSQLSKYHGHIISDNLWGKTIT